MAFVPSTFTIPFLKQPQNYVHADSDNSVSFLILMFVSPGIVSSLVKNLQTASSKSLTKQFFSYETVL